MWWCGGFHLQTLTGCGFGYRHMVVVVVVVMVVVSGWCCINATGVCIGSSNAVNTLNILSRSNARAQEN